MVAIDRRTVLKTAGGAGLAALLAACSGGKGASSGDQGSGKGEIRALFMKQAAYTEADVTKMTAAFTAANPEIKVTPEFVAYEALHDKIVAAGPAGTYDVVLIDVIWPAEFGSKKMITDVTGQWAPEWKTEMLAGAIETAQYDQKLYGVPWIMDSKYLFLNEAHLSLAHANPQWLDTWDGVLKTARRLKEAGVVKYPLIWSWQQAEALVCDYAQLLGAMGGKFLDESGKAAFNAGGGVQALEFMRQTIVDGLTNPASTQSLEADVQRVFQAGQASLVLNWTYMYGAANDAKQSKVAGKVQVAQTPKGSVGRPGVNGGMALCVTAGSKNQAAAFKYISHLTSQPEQEKYALSSLPVWTTSYDEPAVVQTNPKVVPQAKKQLDDLILRPQAKNYNAISQVLQAELQNALLGRKPAQQALDDAADKANSLLQS
ncbi:extracellular solute-binding protein [Kribbella sandramycini]|uniref:Extracellular solute-binding protein n=1 Tax=Kribbella sandramycini TaxID=60450 RepID=A0A7Y4L298_9ACTN|nr:extracellular solute-binding protein [Kribbella sandramycini]MBB6565663.1 multiple sugar transport system substrate-binding protein [Kribbella sandramycini]NOL41926.1 extracellular solute-binding protein [Kribbella sandramycini]